MTHLFYVARPSDTKFSADSDWYRALFEEQNADALASTPEEANSIILFESYSHHTLAYALELLACPFISKHIAKLFTINHNDVAWPLLRGCYTSLGASIVDSKLFRAINYPSVYNWKIEEEAKSPRELPTRYLASFRGSFASHSIRRKMAESLHSKEQFKIVDTSAKWFAHSEDQKNIYVDELLESHFALCPRGNSPSTYRLFESMALGKCPVVISDDWEPPAEIDWESCSIRIAEREVEKLPAVLESKVSDSRRLGEAARKSWLEHFSIDNKYRYYARQIQELATHPAPSAFASADKCRAHWSSFAFRKSVGHILPKRIMRRIRSFLKRNT